MSEVISGSWRKPGKLSLIKGNPFIVHQQKNIPIIREAVRWFAER